MTEKGDVIRKAMQDRKEKGIHVGRPAAFMFEEDVANAPVGRVFTSTRIISENDLYDLARQGYSLYKVARMLGIGDNVLLFEMRPANPDDPKCRYKGTKDRYSVYMELYRQAKERME